MDQAILGGWCELVGHVLQAFDEPDTPILARYAETADGYRLIHRAPGRPLLAAYYGAFVNGALGDATLDGEVALDEATTALLEAHEALRRQGSGGVLDSADLVATAAAAVITDLRSAGFPLEEIERGSLAVWPWQRLLWLAERKVKRDVGAGEDDERLTYLLRLAANHPVLGAWPELNRFIPKRAEGLMALSEDAYRRFRRDGIPDDPELANRLVHEILNDRHYRLETVSVVEIDELGVRRIVLTREVREGSGFRCGVIVEHAIGVIVAELSIHAADDGGRRAETFVPALGLRAAKAVEVDDAQAAIELLVLAVWRDLVVPRVREEQYESSRMRKGRGRGRRAARRGNVEVTRYLPRNLIYRRARRKAARGEGRREPRRLYAVGTFTRRLPAEQHRSREADEHAREIGMPLADHQTVVRPHFRGGTHEEREHAMRSGRGDEVRSWRSWSAVDLLRTRAASKHSA